MHEINLGSVKFVEGLTFTFPEKCCANCGTIVALDQYQQDTRVTTFLFLGGSELKFSLPVTACPKCAPTLARRPLSLANKILIALLVSGALAAVALLAITIGDVSIPVISAHPFLASLIAGATLSAVYFSFHRTVPPQTSYYQPVRISKISRKFSDGRVQNMTFAFTNRMYGQAFAKENQVPIQAGLVVVKEI